MEHTFHYLVFTETEQYGDIYHKADADLVIAERDKVIEEQENLIADLIEKNKRLANKDMIMASETIKGICAELRHNKYKRCLNMAKICENKLGTVVKPGWWDKWRRSWLELAEKFKEAK
mgnify:CR=1 FL=1